MTSGRAHRPRLARAGNFLALLLMLGCIGCNKRPVANAGFDRTVAAGQSITFNAAGSYDPDGWIDLNNWSFGDGTPSQWGQVVSHVYSAVGTYTVTLYVRDDDGTWDTDVALVHVTSGGTGTTTSSSTSTSTSSSTTIGQNVAPSANAGPDRSGAVGQSLTFDGRGSFDPDGSIQAYSWSFGDGSPGRSGSLVSHAFAAPGVYVVTLWVRDDDGTWDSDVALATVSGDAVDWSDKQGGLGSDGTNDLASDAAGNVYAAGFFTGTMVVDGVAVTSAGGTDAFLAKYSPAGDLLWIRRDGGSQDDFAESVAVDPSGNVVIAGRFTGVASLGGASLSSAGGTDVYVAKYTSSGTHVWSRRHGGALSDTGYGVATDTLGNVLVTGYFSGTVDFGVETCRVPFSSDLDVFLLKLSSGGFPVWVNCFANTAAEVGYGVATDASNAVLLVGSFNGHLDLGGGSLDASGVQQDAFVAKFTSAGTHVWSRRAGSTANDIANDVVTDGAGNVLVAGVFRGAVGFGGATLNSNGGSDDGFVVQYSSTGTHRWSRAIGGPDDDVAEAVAVDDSRRVVVVGSFRDRMSLGGAQLTSLGKRDVFAVRHTSGGSVDWTGQGGSVEDDRGFAAATSGEAVHVGGYIKTSAVLGGRQLTCSGSNDGFVVLVVP
jgi:PKD repeat protein